LVFIFKIIVWEVTYKRGMIKEGNKEGEYG
jgi:hypothetical protein